MSKIMLYSGTQTGHSETIAEPMPPSLGCDSEVMLYDLADVDRRLRSIADWL